MTGLAVRVLVLLVDLAPRAGAQPGAEDPAVQRGLQILRSRGEALPAGEAALAGQTMLQADVPATDPNVLACVRVAELRFTGSKYDPEQRGPGGPSVYEAAVLSLLCGNLDPVGSRSR